MFKKKEMRDILIQVGKEYSANVQVTIIVQTIYPIVDKYNDCKAPRYLGKKVIDGFKELLKLNTIDLVQGPLYE